MLSLPIRFLAPIICLLPVASMAGDADSDWRAVIALDAGPQTRPTTQGEAKTMTMGHLATQERALRNFLKEHPEDPHCFEGHLRLSRLLQIRSGLENSDSLRTEANLALEEAARRASPTEKVEVDFARIAFQMRGLKRESRAEREALLLSTRRFQAEHGADRRTARLLTEVAHLFDHEPETQRNLLLGAQKVSTDEELKRRIADDLRRVDLIGKSIALRFTTLSGKVVDLQESRGKVVILSFFAEWSPPSMEAAAKLQKLSRQLPAERVQLLSISLDNKSEDLANNVNKLSLNWPIGFDGKGWSSPTVRTLAVNTLPTVWIIDQAGVLRALNGMEQTVEQVTQLLRRPPAAQ